MTVLLIGFPKYPSAFPLTAAVYLALLAALFAGFAGTDTTQAQLPPNYPAAGTPVISGTARVGELLTVDTSSITDADGLTNATFSYDWLADDGPVTIGDLARITTTENVYRIRPDDVGLAIKVQVDFTDDAGNVEALSSASTATVVASEPDPPEHFTALPGDPGDLDLEWDAPSFDPATGGLRTSTIGDGGSPITSYTVLWREGTGSGCSNTSDVSEAVVASGTMHTIPGLDHTSRYCLRVIATNAVGDSAPSAQLWRGPAPPHNKPATGAPTVEGTLRVGEFVTADTTGIADEDGLTNGTFAYGWLLKPTPDPFSVLRLNYKKRRFLVPPDAAGRTIQVLASIRDDLGHFESLRGAPTAVVAPTFPDPPRDLAVAVGGPGALSVEWEAPVWNVGAWLWDGSTDVGDGGSPITSYTVQWREDTGSWGNPADVSEAVVSTGTTYTISGLDDTLDYYVRVIATNDVGHGEPSAEATATSGGQPPVVVGPTGSPVGGGGGGGGGGPSPSVIDFEWSVTRDIEELDSGHDKPSGTWSDGVTLWVLENGDGTDDAIYAYDVKTGERVEGREFALDGTNRAPRGVWSDGSTAWVSDSGRNHLFAHDLASGERVPERDIALADRNSDARGIWSGDETMWVLDGGTDSLFAYDLASGELLAEYALHDDNSDPHGLWSDGVTVWVSDHGAKRLFAYRLPARPEARADEEAEPQTLERIIDEEFKELSKASNNSPRGLWSDGDVMYVADESDARVYTYNMPNAIDARLSSLTLRGVDFGEFSPNDEEYEGAADEGVTETTVEAETVQRRTDVDIDPPDADESAQGHQVALQDLGAITVTVTSADGSRKKTYRVRLGPEEVAEPAPEEAAGPVASCLRGAVAVGFSLVVYAGGSVDDLVACAEGRNVTALYVLDGGEYVSYILGAPEFVNREFTELFPDGIPAVTPLVTGSNGPASPYPGSDGTGDGDAPQSWPDCLRGEIATGFSLVVYGGGSVEELEACARSMGITALYTLNDGVFVSYIIGAPEFVSRDFREQFPEGVSAITPLVAASDGPRRLSQPLGSRRSQFAFDLRAGRYRPAFGPQVRP